MILIKLRISILKKKISKTPNLGAKYSKYVHKYLKGFVKFDRCLCL